MKYNPIPFLLKAPQPWVRYNLYKNLLNDKSDIKIHSNIRKKMLGDPFIKSLLTTGTKWSTYPLKRHNDANHPLHCLEILVELGFPKDDPGIQEICEQVFAHQASNGAFLTNIIIPKRFKGSGEPSWDWMMCDIPILIYFLSSMGYATDHRVLKAVEHLLGLVRENGFGCSSSIPKFRGPGRKDDHCPYGNLVALKALALFSQNQAKEACRIAIQAQLEFWRNRSQRKIFLFGIGTDFKKLKFPNIYYNIIHVLDVLSLYEEARKSNGFNEMLSIVNSKQLENGGFIPESIWRAFKMYDFGQKKEPSPTLTYTVAVINHRCSLLQEDWLQD
ncbi:MAG: hypothetical protein ACW964_00515 [Candidatus Hodarchaeales archaeon]|jgi:hypothetical protein